jgi:hypothetical protein
MQRRLFRQALSQFLSGFPIYSLFWREFILTSRTTQGKSRLKDFLSFSGAPLPTTNR